MPPDIPISGSQKLCELMGFSAEQITHADYPQEDMLSLSFADEQFDCVASDQVLEHVNGNPQATIDECFRVLEPGGLAVHTTCFINPIHRFPGDFWRFTPDALAYLVRGHGRILDVGGWGNPYVWLYVALGLRFLPIPHARWHPLHWLAVTNREDWPIVTWVAARKHARGQ